MKLSEIDKKAIQSLIQYGLFLETVKVLLECCAEFKKYEPIKDIKNIIDRSLQSLSEKERQTFQVRFNKAIERKTLEFVKQLQGKLTESEVKEFIAEFSTQKD